MAATSDLERFYAYVRAFEFAYLSDDWSLLAPHLTESAWHRVEGGGPFGDGGPPGRANAIAGLRASVHKVDRRFDVRIPRILDGPTTRPDGIFMRFGVTLRRAGLPDLSVEGEHVVRCAGGRIESIEERMAPDVAGRVEDYLSEHGALLRPAGTPADLSPAPADRRDLEAETMKALVRCYGAAKSEADIGAALSVCSEDFSIETVSFGIASKDRKETELQLGVFFGAFPDYRVKLDGFATAAGIATCWGSARLSFSGELLGCAPTGLTAELPIFCHFEVAPAGLRRERFFFDAATLCEQIRLPMEQLTAALGPLRRPNGWKCAAERGSTMIDVASDVVPSHLTGLL